jgi:hypothetical protein
LRSADELAAVAVGLCLVDHQEVGLEGGHGAERPLQIGRLGNRPPL